MRKLGQDRAFSCAIPKQKAIQIMAACAFPKSNLDIVPLLITAVFMGLASPSGFGQAGVRTSTTSVPAIAPYAPTMTFDVASVRENKKVDVNAGITVSGEFRPHTTIFRAINWRIEDLISLAYGVDQSQIVGAPKWPWPTVFVIEAKGGSEADAKLARLSNEQQFDEQKHMLRILLEDRFKLKTHGETKEGDVYNLVVAKSGAKLGPGGSMPPSADEMKNFGEHPVPPIYQKNDGQGYDFIAHGCSMNELVQILAEQFGRPVIDKTGLTAKYDFVLKYKGRWDRDRDADDMDPMPPLDRALQEDLGLKVDAVKGAIKVLAIDHIEKPSEN